ncbi:OadG family protein [Thalassotalea sp. LPB0316]|uniref:OadG family protein n=1 Tax=Thalassotalea sp. LPB0316 TaxID=2769490 RepID=UPI0018667E80|nr:OadG family transporter subunit [Thalassotalea sp. LPB0316]QOL25595.1 OadG family protein [Thalassotalea sp. LPB0316]
MESLNQQFIEAATLMIAGMVFVFAFLGLLVVFINMVLVPLSKKFPDPQPVQKSTIRKPAQVQGIQPNVVAAISAAVANFRQKHNKE